MNKLHLLIKAWRSAAARTKCCQTEFKLSVCAARDLQEIIRTPIGHDAGDTDTHG